LLVGLADALALHEQPDGLAKDGFLQRREPGLAAEVGADAVIKLVKPLALELAAKDFPKRRG
jgi:hypothetical protein